MKYLVFSLKCSSDLQHILISIQSPRYQLESFYDYTGITAGPVFCLLFRVCSGYAQPITGQATEVTCPVIARAQLISTLCHIYASVNRVSIGSDNSLSPILCQSIICTNAGLLSIEPLEINFSEILMKIQTFSFSKIHLKISSPEWRPFCPGGDELTHWG